MKEPQPEPTWQRSLGPLPLWLWATIPIIIFVVLMLLLVSLRGPGRIASTLPTHVGTGSTTAGATEGQSATSIGAREVTPAAAAIIPEVVGERSATAIANALPAPTVAVGLQQGEPVPSGPVPTAAPVTPTLVDSATILAAIRRGGYVIYIRHGERNAYDEPNLPDMQNCATQNILTLRGRQQSVDLGNAYRKLGIPVGTVYSGEFCRNRDSALLAFGKDIVIPELDRFSPAVLPTLRKLYATPPPRGLNTIVVNHHAPPPPRLAASWWTTATASCSNPTGMAASSWLAT